MLGRVRPSSSSLECLELERPPPKIVKDDALSIYEATLLKLRQGSSRRDPVSISEQAVKMDVNCNSSYEKEPMKEDTNCSSTGSSSSSSDLGTLKEQHHKSMSISYLFTRYKSSQNSSTRSLPDKAVMIYNNCPSARSSPVLLAMRIDERQESHL